MLENRIDSIHQASMLASLQHQGDSNDCGPYTIATVINALLKLQINPSTLALEMTRPVWRGIFLVIRRIPNWATFPWGMVDIFRDYGLNASWRLFTPKEYLIEQMKKGNILMPIIGNWRPIWAHVMILIALDPLQGWGFANTQYNQHQITWLSYDYFNKHWVYMAHLLVEVENI